MKPASGALGEPPTRSWRVGRLGSSPGRGRLSPPPLAPLQLEALRRPAAPAPEAALPRGAWWAWYGVHGGAGVTTMCQAIPGGHDVEREWPANRDWPVVVIARSDARGLMAAQQVAMRTAPGGEFAAQRVLGLVVVPDQPRRLPAVLVDLGRLVSGGYDLLWQVPYGEQWRLGGDPSATTLPMAVRRLALDLYELCEVPAGARSRTTDHQPTTHP